MDRRQAIAEIDSGSNSASNSVANHSNNSNINTNTAADTNDNNGANSSNSRANINSRRILTPPSTFLKTSIKSHQQQQQSHPHPQRSVSSTLESSFSRSSNSRTASLSLSSASQVNLNTNNHLDIKGDASGGVFKTPMRRVSGMHSSLNFSTGNSNSNINNSGTGAYRPLSPSIAGRLASPRLVSGAIPIRNDRITSTSNSNGSNNKSDTVETGSTGNENYYGANASISKIKNKSPERSKFGTSRDGNSGNNSGGLRPSANITRSSQASKKNISSAAVHSSNKRSTKSGIGGAMSPIEHSANPGVASTRGATSTTGPTAVPTRSVSASTSSSSRRSLGPGVTMRSELNKTKDSGTSRSATRSISTTLSNGANGNGIGNGATEKQRRNEQLDLMAQQNEEQQQKLQRIIVKLQDKLHSMAVEIEKLQEQIASLESENTKLKQSVESNEDDLEMLTIDKEFLDEKNQLLNSKLENLNNDYDELKEQFNTLQQQMKKQYAQENDDTTDTSAANEALSENIFERNKLLETALVKLRQVSDEKENELVGKIQSLESETVSLKEYQDKYQVVSNDLEQAQLFIQDLKAQVDSSLEATELIETLSEKNINLNEENTKLRETVQELEDLRDIANDLEEAHNQSEKELHKDIDRLKKVIENDKLEIANFEKKTKYFESLLNAQRQKYQEELSQSKAELSGVLQNSTQYEAIGDVNLEILHNKINELNVKVGKLENINIKADLESQILRLDYKNEKELKEIFEQFLQDMLSSSEDDAGDLHNGTLNNKLINCDNLIKCTNILPSIIEITKSIIMVLLNTKRASLESPAENAHDSGFPDGKHSVYSKDFSKLGFILSILLTKIKYDERILEDSQFNFEKLLSSLNHIYQLFKDLYYQISTSELKEDFGEILIYAFTSLKACFANKENTTNEESEAQVSKTEKIEALANNDLLKNLVLKWDHFHFMNRRILAEQLSVYQAYVKTSTYYLKSVKEFNNKDISITLEGENEKVRSVTDGLFDLYKKFGTLQIILEKQQNNLDNNVDIQMWDLKDLIITPEEFLLLLKNLDNLVFTLSQIHNKIEFEHYSFTSELEDKNFETIFVIFLDNMNILSDFCDKANELTTILTKFSTDKLERVSLNSIEPSFKVFFKNYLQQQSKAILKAGEIESLNAKIEEMSNGFNEKDQLISQLYLKIDLLKSKLEHQNEKEQKLVKLELEIKKILQEAQRQRNTISELFKVNELQKLELNRKLKNKNLIGDFGSIFEEKEFCSKLTLMSEVQSMRDLVNYLTVKVTTQAYSSSKDSTTSVFGIPTTYDWLNESEQAFSLSYSKSDYKKHKRLNKLSHDYLIDTAKNLKFLNIRKPENDQSLFERKPRQLMLDYYIATVDRKLSDYKASKKLLINELKKEMTNV